MNEHLEIEYKILLTKEIYEKIVNDYKSAITSIYSQTNFYFTHPLLSKHKMMLRIRKKGNQYELTLKRPYQGHNIETNVALTKQEKDDFINHLEMHNEIIEILSQYEINYQDLKQEYSLTTIRTDIQLKEGVLSLDKNTYTNHMIDYELEFEVDNKETGYQKFLNIIKPYHLNYSHNCESKFKRVLKNY